MGEGEAPAARPRQAPYATGGEAIRGRRIWLSGGLGGLGLEFSRAFLQHGCACLALVDLADEATGQAAAERLRDALPASASQLVRYYQADVRDAGRVRESMRDAAAAFGGLDTVVNNAGVADGDAERVIAVNLVAVIAATRAALAVFGEAGGATDRVIVNMGSSAGVHAVPLGPAYAASKHGVVGYTRSMRNACWRRGVRINCLCPSWVSVGMGSTVPRVGDSGRPRAFMEKEQVSAALVEMFRRRDMTGEAVYVSHAAEPRVVRADLESKLSELQFAKM